MKILEIICTVITNFLQLDAYSDAVKVGGGGSTRSLGNLGR